MRKAALPIFLILAAQPAPGVVKLSSKENLCKDSGSLALVKEFDPARDYPAATLEQVLKISAACPEMRLPTALAQSAEKKLRAAVFLQQRARFESLDPGINWQILKDYAAKAGHSEAQLGSLMAPFLAKAKNDCAPRDQRAKLPPVWNQGNQGWCYAYAGAAMASYILQEPVSPDAMAIRFAMKNTWYGGDLLETLKISQQKGFCRADEIAFAQDLQDSGYDPARNSFADIRELAREFYSINGQRVSSLPEDAACRDLLTPLAVDFASALRLNAKELVHILQKAAANNMVKRYMSEECVPVRRPLQAEFRDIVIIDPRHPGEIQSYEREFDLPRVTAEDARRQLQAALREDKVVGVGTFDSSVIGAGDKDHAMVIVGQGWNERTRQCEVILRNSWGSHCLPGLDSDSICDGKGNYTVPIGKVLSHRFSFTLY